MAKKTHTALFMIQHPLLCAGRIQNLIPSIASDSHTVSDVRNGGSYTTFVRISIASTNLGATVHRSLESHIGRGVPVCLHLVQQFKQQGPLAGFAKRICLYVTRTTTRSNRKLILEALFIGYAIFVSFLYRIFCVSAR